MGRRNQGRVQKKVSGGFIFDFEKGGPKLGTRRGKIIKRAVSEYHN